jgi:hypothetical protein
VPEHRFILIEDGVAPSVGSRSPRTVYSTRSSAEPSTDHNKPITIKDEPKDGKIIVIKDEPFEGDREKFRKRRRSVSVATTATTTDDATPQLSSIKGKQSIKLQSTKEETIDVAALSAPKLRDAASIVHHT